jgi:SNF2 family DNA or RNA helicase
MSAGLVWEAFWDTESRCFCLWAESGDDYAEVRKAERRSGTAHPFAASSETLEHYLRDAEIEQLEAKEFELFLPTVDGIPLCSPKFRLSSSGTEEEVRRQAWQVPVLALPPLEAILFLSSPSEPAQSALRLDDSVAFFREVTKLCLDLLTRGRFVPGLVWGEGAYRGAWIPILNESADLDRMSVLASSMPGVCSAACQRQTEPRTLAESFIEATSDELIRLFLRRFPLLPDDLKPRQMLAAEWLKSLTSSNGSISATEAELAPLEERIRRWSGRLLPVGKSQKLQTLFRILAPSAEEADDEPQWTIEFLLRSKNNPDALLTAEQLWAGDLGFLRNSEPLHEEIEDGFLCDLGRAAKVYPQLQRAMSETYPARLIVSTDEVYDFLKNQSRTLEEMGFGLLLPSWWNKPNSKLGLKLALESGGIEGLSHVRTPFLASQQLLDFSWNIAFGDRELSRQEFQEIISKRSPLVRIEGQWVELDPDQVNATLNFLDEQDQRGKLTFIEALHLGLGLEERTQTFPIVGFSAKGWIQQFLDSDNSYLKIDHEPEGFLGELRPYQRDGLAWLALRSQLGIGACLADDMGLGKTVQLLALILYQQIQAREAGRQGPRQPLLLIVPMSILTNWEQEILRFAPTLTYYVHHGAQRLVRDQFIEKARNTDVVITTYSLAFRDEEFLRAVTWAGVVLDEAQNIKNTETKQTKAIRRLCHGQFKRAEGSVPFQRIALTGTPLENHLEELWSIFDFLNPGFLGNLASFRTRFAIPIERFRNRTAAEALSRLVRPFVLRRLKSDPKIISDLPEKIEVSEVLPLTREQAGLYQAALDEMLPQVEAAVGMHRKGLVLATITKLKQICNHPALFLKDGSSIAGRSHKISRLEELLEEIVAEGDKVLLFTQFSQLGHLLQPYLQQRFDTEVLFLHGALPKQAREKIVSKFQQPSGPPIFILSLKAGGFGLNLTEANQVIHLDQWWNPAVEDQATDRAYRIGQKRNVQVRKLICQGTLEERIAEMLKHKKELADQIVGSTKDSIMQLSTDELRRLLELSSVSHFTEGSLQEGEEAAS